MNKQKPRKNY